MEKRRKKTPALSREAEIESARLFGRHVAGEKALFLFWVTLLACAAPMQLGLRLWKAIPEVVETGLVGLDGQDDSLPRWAVVFAVPGLMCLLNGICHGQLWLNQKRLTLPHTPVRLVGRWGFPVISVLFCSGLVFESAGQGLTAAFLLPCLLGLALMQLGGHMWDCPPEARLALSFWASPEDTLVWRRLHRFAAWVWCLGGLGLIEAAMVTEISAPLAAACTLALLALPALPAKRGGF